MSCKLTITTNRIKVLNKYSITAAVLLKKVLVFCRFHKYSFSPAIHIHLRCSFHYLSVSFLKPETRLISMETLVLFLAMPFLAVRSLRFLHDSDKYHQQIVTVLPIHQLDRFVQPLKQIVEIIMMKSSIYYI